MPRRRIESMGSLGLDDVAPAANGAVAASDAAPEAAEEPAEDVYLGAKRAIEPLLSEVFITDEAVKRNKKLKEDIKSFLIDTFKLNEVECECGVAKISEKTSESVDEEGLMVDLVAKGYGKFVKERVVRYVDMEAIESAMYEEDEGSGCTPITDLVRGRTTKSVTRSLLVRASKPNKEKGGSK